MNLTEAAPCSHCQYSLNFYGPLVTCARTSAATEAVIYSAIRNATNTEDYFSTSLLYTSFVPQNLNSANFSSALANGVNDVYGGHYYTKDEASTDYAKIYVQYQLNTTLECGLYNASYEADFQFTNGAQAISIKNVTKLNGIPYSAMSTYMILNGYRSCPTCYNDTWALRQELEYPAYFAVGEALNMVLVGLIDGTMYSGVVTSGTQVMSSSLSVSIPRASDDVISRMRHPEQQTLHLVLSL